MFFIKIQTFFQCFWNPNFAPLFICFPMLYNSMLTVLLKQFSNNLIFSLSNVYFSYYKTLDSFYCIVDYDIFKESFHTLIAIWLIILFVKWILNSKNDLALKQILSFRIFEKKMIFMYKIHRIKYILANKWNDVKRIQVGCEK